jgi:hypothetical protein
MLPAVAFQGIVCCVTPFNDEIMLHACPKKFFPKKKFS